MKRTLIIYMILTGVINTAFGENTDNAFLIEVDSISLGLQKNTDEYSLEDFGRIFNNRESKMKGIDHYPEIKGKVNSSLKQEGFLELDLDHGCNKEKGAAKSLPDVEISIHHSWADYHIKYNKFTFSLHAKRNKTDEPLWQISALSIPPFNPHDIRITLPSVIKCIAPYFNKNFKGTITCKR